MSELGLFHAMGHGCDQNDTKAVEWYEKSAQLGYSAAMFYLGNCYKEGDGVTKDLNQAREWYTKAAARGFARAQTQLSHLICFDMFVNIEQETNGYHWAQFFLGKCYRYGHGTDQDYTKAFEWFTKSSEQGNCTAMKFLGLCCCGGIGCDENGPKGIEWLEKSAQLGNSGAMKSLHDLYSGEIGCDVVPVNWGKSREWEEKWKRQTGRIYIDD